MTTLYVKDVITNFIGNIFNILSNGNIIIYLLFSLTIAYIISELAVKLYDANLDDAEMRKRTQRENYTSKRNIKIFVFILTIGAAFFVKFINQL